MWKITETTDGQHVGERIDSAEPGQIITFPDGDVVAISRIFNAQDGNQILACGTNYQMTLTKE